MNTPRKSKANLKLESNDCSEILSKVDSLSSEIRDLLQKYSSKNTQKIKSNNDAFPVSRPPREQEAPKKSEENPFTNPSLKEMKINPKKAENESYFQSFKIEPMIPIDSFISE